MVQYLDHKAVKTIWQKHSSILSLFCKYIDIIILTLSYTTTSKAYICSWHKTTYVSFYWQRNKDVSTISSRNILLHLSVRVKGGSLWHLHCLGHGQSREETFCSSPSHSGCRCFKTEAAGGPEAAFITMGHFICHSISGALSDPQLSSTAATPPEPQQLLCTLLDRWVSPTTQMGTPSLSSSIHLSISWLLTLLFFEKWLPTSSCPRVITSHLAEQQSCFLAPAQVVLQLSEFPENQSAWLASVSPLLLQQRNISSYFFPASSSMSSTWHIPSAEKTGFPVKGWKLNYRKT